jgi:hypothetical protein
VFEEEVSYSLFGFQTSSRRKAWSFGDRNSFIVRVGKTLLGRGVSEWTPGDTSDLYEPDEEDR